MASAESPLASTSIGSGLWLWLALCLLACSDAIRRLISSAVWRWVLNAQLWCHPLCPLFSGELNNLSLLKEYANRQEVFDNALGATSDDPLRHADPALLLGVRWACGVTAILPPGCRLCRAQRHPDHPFRCAVWPADCPLAGW